MNIGLLRLKMLLAEHGRPLFWVFLISGFLAFIATGWVYATPPTEQITEKAHQQTVSTVVNTSAPVTGNSTLWARGATISDQAIYPMAAPTLTLSVRTTVPPNERVTVNQELHLIYRATRGETTFWRSISPLSVTQTTTTTGSISNSATISIPDIREQLDSYNSELTGLGRAEAVIKLRVSYETRRYSGELTKTSSLAVAENGYWFEEPLTASTTHSQQVTREVQGQPDQTLLFILGGLGIILLGSAGGTWYYRDLDRPAIKERLERRRFEEWISEGHLDVSPAGREVPVLTLADLVDIAIDSNKRVIRDPARERYAVLDGDVLYRFDPYETHTVSGNDPSERIRESLDDQFDDGESEISHDAWDDLLTRQD